MYQVLLITPEQKSGLCKQLFMKIQNVPMNNVCFNINDTKNQFFDAVICDIACHNSIQQYSNNIKEDATFYLFISQSIIKMEDNSFLSELEKECYNAKDWKKLKKINAFKIELNHIRKKTLLDTFSKFLQIECTNVCNARCIMCNHFYDYGRQNLHINNEFIDKIDKILPYIEVMSLHGQGEPFLCKDISKYLSYFSKYDIKFQANTNLSVITNELLELVNTSFVSLNISCDGCTKEVYEEIRRNLSFEKFCQNLKRVVESCPTLKKSLYVVAMRQNLMQIPEFVDFAAKYKITEIIFTNLGVSPIIMNDNDSLINYPGIAKEQFQMAKKDSISYLL